MSLPRSSAAPSCKAEPSAEHGDERPRGTADQRSARPRLRGLSESNAATDQVDKFRVYASSEVPFYWIGDPQRRILTAYKLEGTTYAVALQAKAGETVHAPPFEAAALRVGLLFGEDPD